MVIGDQVVTFIDSDTDFATAPVSILEKLYNRFIAHMDSYFAALANLTALGVTFHPWRESIANTDATSMAPDEGMTLDEFLELYGADLLPTNGDEDFTSGSIAVFRWFVDSGLDPEFVDPGATVDLVGQKGTFKDFFRLVTEAHAGDASFASSAAWAIWVVNGMFQLEVARGLAMILCIDLRNRLS